MKKTGIIVLAGLVIAGIVLLFTTFTVTETATIHAPINEVAAQFNRPSNWKNWHGNAGTADSIEVRDPVSVTVVEANNGRKRLSYLVAEPASNGQSTKIHLVQKQTGYQWLAGKLGSHPTIVSDLKSYMEDDKRRYGFPISIVPVNDTLILTAKKLVVQGNRLETIDFLRRQLIHFIAAAGISRAADYYFVSSSSAPDQRIEVAAGIPVTTTTGQPKDFQFLKLPANGRLLAGTYRGPYEERKKLYAAMDKYVLDKKLKKVAQPLEKYHLSDTAFTAGKHIETTIYYPIY